ncbi:MAG: tetratricopeptide repeat protein [Tannerella sp.]|nr:tetratricopeptide repeat protein [Tannerella sp.]
MRLTAIIAGMTAGLLYAGTVLGQKAKPKPVHKEGNSFSLYGSEIFTGTGKATERKHIREGNTLYNSEKFTEAEIAYRKSVDVNPRSVEGAYDLGNALYRQQKYPEAAEQYQLVTGQSERLLSENRTANATRLAQVYHNLGNIGMQSKEYAKSVEAYKQSLRLNPKDDETRYNLALAQKLLDDQQQQEQDQQQNQDQQEQQEQEQNREDQQQQQQQDQEQKTQEQPQPDEQMSQDNAQQLLDAFLQDEKDTQEKVKKAQAKQQERRRTDKQW